VTNEKYIDKDAAKLEKDFGMTDGISLKRGDYFGEFNLGSSIVLIFEAPKGFKFNITENQKVFLGEPLGSAA
jgi:phosphatidylserine decarboxylase